MSANSRAILDPSREKWLRQPSESEQAWEYFRAYRDSGSEGERRDIAKLADEHDWNIEDLYKVSRQWKWLERTVAYDNFLQVQYAIGQARKAKEAGERHASIAKSMQEKIAERLLSLDIQTLSPATLAKWLDISVKVERQALGMMDTPSIVTHVGDQGGPIRFEKTHTNQQVVDAAHHLIETMQAIEIEPVRELEQ